jgi:imidazolonepropionase-like amidohydrolase
MRADLVLLQNNPLADIQHTRGIEAVMVSGEWVR